MEYREQLRTYRKSRRMTISDVAGKLGVTVATVSGWESGKRSPSLETFGRWADALGLTVLITERTDSAVPPMPPTKCSVELVFRIDGMEVSYGKKD